ncbi:hypothetical protein Mal48_36940 [Thalassoglobus polymorphus]|uniref:Uncharacterized protein n=1 Tax=Thalassoglobus polymorphus TaxID=2527994 RepID=A0A517QS33_9PLAN|nr:hypothetical protein Mal48_36940 [Thalassoglobus polymorphus]
MTVGIGSLSGWKSAMITYSEQSHDVRIDHTQFATGHKGLLNVG